MPDVADVLEGESRTVDLEPGDFERLLGRRQRKERTGRVRGGVVAVVVALAVGFFLLRSLPPRSIPGHPPVKHKTFWPQTSLQEVRHAQERADAGDPRYTWQRAVSEIQ